MIGARQNLAIRPQGVSVMHSDIFDEYIWVLSLKVFLPEPSGLSFYTKTAYKMMQLNSIERYSIKAS
jgi:hypothetical protein